MTRVASRRSPPLLYLFHFVISHSLAPSLLLSSYLNHSLLLSNQNKMKTTCLKPLLARITMKKKKMGRTVQWFLKESGSGRSSEISQETMTEVSSLKLTAKEKKKLASYAHSLGDKLKSHLVGKSGVTDSVVLSFLETLEKNELLKVKIHRTCPGELDDIILHLEEATGSVTVGQIARTVILYRPSPTKLEAEEKKTKR